jgi:hypothetical protein
MLILKRKIILRGNLVVQGKWSNVMSFDLAEIFTSPALEYSHHVYPNM